MRIKKGKPTQPFTVSSFFQRLVITTATTCWFLLLIVLEGVPTSHGMSIFIRQSFRSSRRTFYWTRSSSHLYLHQQQQSVPSSSSSTITASTRRFYSTTSLLATQSTTGGGGTSFPDLPPAQASLASSPSTLDPQTSHSTMSDSLHDNDEQSFTPYEQWVRRLYMTNLFHPVKLGLQNIHQLYDALGKPLDNIPVIHVAGTNGKGSVVWKVAQTLQNNDKRIGMFVSPHISSFRERMQVNGQLISEDAVVQLLPRIYEICERDDIPATFFEITTALAMAYFAQQQVDAVVLETGLGGRLDSTNVLAQPTLAIITSIGLEHTRILGDTIELIALEKGGIIKPNRPVLVGPNVPHDVLRQCAQEKGASQYYVSDDLVPPAVVPESSHDNDDTDTATTTTPLDYDQENARIARAAMRLLQDLEPSLTHGLTEEMIDQGTSQRPPCRFEQVVLPNQTQVILDVAHNPPAMEYLVHKLRATFPDKQFRVVVGMSADKDLVLSTKAIIQVVDGDASRIHLVQAAHPRAATVQDILEATRDQGLLTDAQYDLDNTSVTQQVQSAMKLTDSTNEILVVCGSVFLMSEAREALGFDEPRDSEYIAQVAGAGSRHGQENFGNSGAATKS